MSLDNAPTANIKEDEEEWLYDENRDKQHNQENIDYSKPEFYLNPDFIEEDRNTRTDEKKILDTKDHDQNSLGPVTPPTPTDEDNNNLLAENNDNINSEKIDEQQQEGSFEDEDDDEDDDGVNIVISEIVNKPYAQTPSTPSATSLITRQKSKTISGNVTGTTTAGQLATTGVSTAGVAIQAIVKSSQQVPVKGVDLDAPGLINDQPTYEYDILDVKDEDKPWRKPGADITDYFNYGFTEETWIAYCMKQKRLRAENSAFKATNIPIINQTTNSNPALISINPSINGTSTSGQNGNIPSATTQTNGISAINQPNQQQNITTITGHHSNMMQPQQQQQFQPKMPQQQFQVRFPQQQFQQQQLLQQQQQRKMGQIDVIDSTRRQMGPMGGNIFTDENIIGQPNL
jgi:pre-mRNA 3'-end-processing factor FIP1